MSVKTKYLFLLLLSGLLWLTSCSLEQVAEEKNGRLYGVTKGTFRDRWWNYYERGMSFADGGFLEKAEADLYKAVRQRKDDQRRARTYGRHFIDYFPHCELGIVFYNQGRIQKAISELETSLFTVKFAKAEYYLDLARKTLIEKEHHKQGAPEIMINQPGMEYVLTNAFSVEVRGIARDDNNFIRYISVGDKKIRIDVSGRKIPFHAEVPVSPGINRIPVRAVNLMGKSSEIFVTVNADHIGPLISIDDTLAAPGTARVMGYAFDDSGVAEIVINKQKFSLGGTPKELLIERTVPVEPGQKDIIIKAVDIAGNITCAAIPLQYEALSGFSSLLAENSLYQKKVLSDGAEKQLLVSNKNPGSHPFVKINLNNSKTKRTTYLDRIVIDGKISSHEKMTKLFINGNEILQSPRRNFHFCYIAELEQGENLINITALAPSHHSDAAILKIKREITCIRKPEARLKLALNAFTKEKTENVETQMGVGFENRLAIAMLEHSPRRFFRVENLRLGENDNEILRKTARANGFHCIVFGHILERTSHDNKNSIIINARIEDTENGDIIVETQDVYEEADKDTIDDKLKFLSKQMKLKLIDELPVVEGRILEKHKNEWIAVNLGKENKVKKGMELIVYQAGEDILGFDDVTDRDTEELGEAKIKAVKTEESLAYIKETSDKEKIQTKHRVITR